MSDWKKEQAVRKLKVEKMEEGLAEKEKDLTPRLSKVGPPKFGQRHFTVYKIDINYDDIEQLPEYLQDTIWEMEGEEIHHRDGINGGRNGEHITIRVDDWNGYRDIRINWRHYIKTVYEGETA